MLRIAAQHVGHSESRVAKIATSRVFCKMSAAVRREERILPLAVGLLRADMNDRRPLLFVEPITKLKHVLLVIKRMLRRLRTLGLLAHVILEKPRADDLRDL